MILKIVKFILSEYTSCFKKFYFYIRIDILFFFLKNMKDIVISIRRIKEILDVK